MGVVLDFCYSKSLHQSVPVVFVPTSKPYLKMFVLEIEFFQLLVHFPGDRRETDCRRTSKPRPSSHPLAVPTGQGRFPPYSAAPVWHQPMPGFPGAQLATCPPLYVWPLFFLSALALAAARHRFRDMGTAYQGHGVLQSLDHIASSVLFPLLAPLLRRWRKVIEHRSANELETWVDNRTVMIEK